MAHKFVGFDTFRSGGGGWLIRAEERRKLVDDNWARLWVSVCECVLSRIDCYFIYKKAPFKVQLCARCFLPT